MSEQSRHDQAIRYPPIPTTAQPPPPMPTVTVELAVPSLMVSVPVPDPVVMVSVADVADNTDWLNLVTPPTPEIVKVVLPFQPVPVPVSVRTMLPELAGGTARGDAVMLVNTPGVVSKPIA